MAFLTAPPRGATRARLARALLLGLLLPLAAAAQDEPIVFGADAVYPPFEWRDGDTVRGYDVDLEDAMAEAGGVRAEHRTGDWPEMVRALESGAVDVLPMFYSEARAERFLFTPPFHFVNHGIYGRSGRANVSSVRDLAGRRVAVEELSYAHQRLMSDAVDAELVLTANTLAALRAVAEDRADYAVLSAPVAEHWIRELGLQVRNLGPPLWPRGYAFAVSRERPELAEWLTERFYEALRSGTFEEVYARWQSRLAPTEPDAWSRWRELAAVPLAALTLLGLGLAWRQRRKVAAHAAHLVQEVTRRAAAESEAEWMKDHDVYTDVPRLHHFSARVSALLERMSADDAPPMQIVALRLVELDRTIRTLGHDAGIQAMRAFADRLKAMDFEAYGQTGRDVFLVFGEKQRTDECLRGTASLGTTIVLESGVAPHTFAGAAVWPKHGQTLSELLRRAETALAVATEKRHGWVVYDASMEPDESALELLRTFRATRGAGIYPVFQPQIDLETGALTGAEALVRWNVPGHGPVSPARFVPLLEDTGLIEHLTSRMLHDAVRVAAKLRRLGLVCPISVNVAAADLLTQATRRTIFEALRAHGGLPSDLKLELTETSVAESPDTIRWVISRLREDGILTSIDDFGTGYSSLSYLSAFPIQELKIDRGFVAGMTHRAQDRSIVRSTIAMARELALDFVAEGVETEEQVAALQREGCHRVQGFLIARPSPEEAFVELVQAWDAESSRKRYVAGLEDSLSG